MPTPPESARWARPAAPPTVGVAAGLSVGARRRSLARPQAAADSPLRGELEEWMDRAREAGLEREDVTALVTSVLEERYAGTTVAAGKTEASGARSTGE